jgi:hypothetical protein
MAIEMNKKKIKNLLIIHNFGLKEKYIINIK